MKEIWRAIPGHDGYEASNQGRIRSLDRRVLLKNRWGNYEWRSYRGRILKSPQNGYCLRVKLGQHDNGYDVHTLVMLAFRGPRPDGMVVRHRDGDGTNNYLSNLRYASYEQNYADSVRHKTAPRGERHYNARLTEQAVLDIRQSSASTASLARKYQVSATTVHDVRHGLKWRWLSGDDKTGDIRTSVIG